LARKDTQSGCIAPGVKALGRFVLRWVTRDDVVVVKLVNIHWVTRGVDMLELINSANRSVALDVYNLGL
jgi:hypothetical protein